MILEKMIGLILLENGSYFKGTTVGKNGTAFGEFCFNTGHSGYQETISDPSYAGQILVFTFPHIGNVGCNSEDMESDKVSLSGVVLGSYPSSPTNHRHQESLESWLFKNSVTAVADVATRQLVKEIRESGSSLKGCITHVEKSFLESSSFRDLLDEIRLSQGLENQDLAQKVSSSNAYTWCEGARYHTVIVDYGFKHNIANMLKSFGNKVTIVPAKTTAEEILAHKPDGILLSNGPGDPRAMISYAKPCISKLLDSGIPILGICLGYQLIANCYGARIKKMTSGHHGINHPVKNISSGEVLITSQNHEFEVELETIPANITPSHISLFDDSLEGFSVKGKPIIALQFHPEASPGPHEGYALFEDFNNMMDSYAKTK